MTPETFLWFSYWDKTKITPPKGEWPRKKRKSTSALRYTEKGDVGRDGRKECPRSKNEDTNRKSYLRQRTRGLNELSISYEEYTRDFYLDQYQTRFVTFEILVNADLYTTQETKESTDVLLHTTYPTTVTHGTNIMSKTYTLITIDTYINLLDIGV